MKDLYKQYNLPPLTTDFDLIERYLSYIDDSDTKAGKYVLLHKGRKEVYDKTYKTLQLIGQLRADIGMTYTGFWGSQYTDFNIEILKETPKYTERKKYYRNSTSNIDKKQNSNKSYTDFPFAYFGGLLLVIIIFAYIINLDDSPKVKSSDITPKYGENKIKESVFAEMYVNTDALNLRSGPGVKTNVLERLVKYQNIYANPGKSVTDWVYVITDNNKEGYVSKRYVAEGNGNDAYLQDCRNKGIKRLRNGSVVKRRSSGPHRLVVHNQPNTDAMVKLKDSQKRTTIQFYVRSGQSAQVNNVPEGYYQFQYATGDQYSPACDTFLVNMQSFKDPELKPYTTEYRGNMVSSKIHTYTLRKVSHGNFRPQKMKPGEF